VDRLKWLNVYITRFGGLLPGRFCRSQLLPGKRWLRPSGEYRLITVPSSDRDKRKLIGIWHVSGLTTLSWEILMTRLTWFSKY